MSITKKLGAGKLLLSRRLITDDEIDLGQIHDNNKDCKPMTAFKNHLFNERDDSLPKWFRAFRLLRLCLF